MVYYCTRCDKPLTPKEVKACQCSNCGLEFKITKNTDASLFQEDLLIERLSEEISTKPRKIDYHETAVRFLKVYLGDVVILRGVKYTKFYRVWDQEIVMLVFALRTTAREIVLEFDRVFRYVDVVTIPPERRKSRAFGTMKSYYKTRNIEKALEIAMAVYKVKSKKYWNREAPKNLEINFYRKSNGTN